MSYFTHYKSGFPADYGALYIEADPRIAYAQKLYSVFECFIKIALICIILYIAYYIITRLYEEYKRYSFLIEDTNRKVTLIEEYLSKNKVSPIKKPLINMDDIKITNHDKSKESQAEFLVDKDGTVFPKSTETNEKIEE